MKNPITTETEKDLRGKVRTHIARLGKASGFASTKDNAVTMLLADIDALSDERFNCYVRVSDDGSVWVLRCTGASTPTHRAYTYEIRCGGRPHASSCQFSATSFREAQNVMDKHFEQYNERSEAS